MNVVDFEIAHINISVRSEEEKKQQVAAFAEKQAFDEDEGIAGCPYGRYISELSTPLTSFITSSMTSLDS